MKQKTKKRPLFLLMAILMLASACVTAGCGSKALALTDSSFEVELYEEFTLAANKSGDIIWESSDPRTVRVSDGGILTSLRLGSAIITATLNGQSAECEVTVVTSTKSRALIVSDDTVEVLRGQTETLTADIRESGKSLDVNLHWTSEDTSVASVKNGVITGIDSGETKVTVQGVYKGQTFSKVIDVICKDMTVIAADMDFVDLDSSGTLEAFEGSPEALGFDTDADVLEWTPGSLWNSRIWPSQSVYMNGYDRLIFDIVFSAADTGDVVVWNFGNTVLAKGGRLNTGGSEVLFYDTDGEICTDALAADTIYTVVINLNMCGNDVDLFGLGVEKPVKVYIANSFACSYDWYKTNYDHNLPKEKVTKGLYFVYGQLTAGQPPVAVEKATEEGYTNWALGQQTNSLWNSRIIIGHNDMESYYGINAIQIQYRKYDYYGFDVLLKDAPAGNIVVWTGGYALFINKDTGKVTAEGTNVAIEDDIVIIKKSDKTNVTGTKLTVDTVYTFKIRIQKIDLKKSSFGCAIQNSEETGQ